MIFLSILLWKGIYPAVIALMITMPLSLLIKYLKDRSIDKIQLWSTIFLIIAGFLTLYFKNPFFLMWKPTIFYWVLSLIFLLSQFISDKPLAQKLLKLIDKEIFEKITPQSWNKINLTWVIFFIVSGFLNIIVAYNYDFETWAAFKVFGLMALTFIFMVGQTIWIVNYIGKEKIKDLLEK
tara:strand:- start:1259 stop:1798 length:540 start_codon:yes stop_codon:yes gene_type:complete